MDVVPEPADLPIVPAVLYRGGKKRYRPAPALRDALRIYELVRLCRTNQFVWDGVTLRWWSQSPKAVYFSPLSALHLFYREISASLALNVKPQPGKNTHINIRYPHQSETGN